jgi:hypothetical protein
VIELAKEQNLTIKEKVKEGKKAKAQLYRLLAGKQGVQLKRSDIGEPYQSKGVKKSVKDLRKTKDQSVSTMSFNVDNLLEKLGNVSSLKTRTNVRGSRKESRRKN